MNNLLITIRHWKLGLGRIKLQSGVGGGGAPFSWIDANTMKTSFVIGLYFLY